MGNITKKIALGSIRCYQYTLSPDHGMFSRYIAHGCKHMPTCSEYTYQAIEKYGITKGVYKGIWRILRCNPWGKGGYDPL